MIINGKKNTVRFNISEVFDYKNRMDDKDQELLLSIVTRHLEKVTPGLAEEFKVRSMSEFLTFNITLPSSAFIPLRPELRSVWRRW